MCCIAPSHQQQAANLDVKTLSFPVENGIEEITVAQLSGQVELPICVLGGTAYAGWLSRQYPSMKLHGVYGDPIFDVIEALQEGTCE